MLTGLIVRNFTPLLKKGTSYVELDIKKFILNILLGRNGFGKTTLLSLITPMPPDNADFGPDGYKEWRYVDERGTFILKGSTGKNSVHEFIFNGKNLNEGKTLLVQRELVKIHFGVTQQIVNILTGLDVRDLFTTLSAARRKEFLMAVNPNDTSYALKVYEKLKSNYNTIRGGLKTQRQRLVVEEARLTQLATMDAEKLEIEIAQLDTQIKDALVLHGILSGVEQNDLKPIKLEIDNIISRLLGNDTIIKGTRGQYLEQKEAGLRRLAHLTTLSTKLSTMHSEITQQLQGLDAGTQSLEGYKARLGMIEGKLDKLKLDLELTENFFVGQSFFQEGFYRDEDLLVNAHELMEQLRLVHKARDPEATGTKYKGICDRLVIVKNELANLQSDITQINHQLDHYRKADTVSCPECAANFKIGFEKFNPSQLEAIRDEKVVQLKRFESEAEKLNDYIENNEEWYSSMTAYHRFLRRLREPGKLLEMSTHFNVGKTDIQVLLECIRRSIEIDNIIKQITQLEEEHQHLLTQIKYLESSDVTSLFARAGEVERELAYTQRSIGRVKEELRKIDDAINTIIADDLLRDKLTFLATDIHTKLIENGKYAIKLKTEQAIDELCPLKDQLIANLIRAKSLNSVIDSMKETIADLEKKEKHTLLLMEGLSPVKGLIGYLMNDFLKAVVGNINAIIQQVWTTRLRVMNCSTSKTDDDVDLSYSFPVLVGDSDKPNKDIGLCSGGEREIINFAFRVVILRYLGPKCGVPLMMDEVGVALDELHRGRFYSWVEEQHRLDTLPMTFMISHNYAQFSRNLAANFIALNVEGLNVPANMNQHSIIR